MYPISTMVTGTWHQLIPLMVSVSQTYSLWHPVDAHSPSKTSSESRLLSAAREALYGFSGVWQIVIAPLTDEFSEPLA